MCKLQKNPPQRKALHISMLIIFIPLLLITSFSFAYIYRSNVQRQENAYSMMLNRISEHIDINMQHLASFSNAMAKSTWVNKLAALEKRYSVTDERMDPYEMLRYSQYVKDLSSGLQFVSEIAFYFRRAEWVLSSILQSDSQWFFQNAMVFSDMTEAEYEKLFRAVNFQTVLPIQRVKLLADKYPFNQNKAIRNGILYLHAIPINSALDEAKAMLIMFIDSNEMRDRIAQFYDGAPTQTFLYNRQTCKFLYSDATDRNAAVQSALAAHTNGAKFSLSKDGETYSFFQESRYDPNWTYVMTLPSASVNASNAGFPQLLLLILLVTFMASVFVSLLIQRVSVRPVKNMMSRIRSSLNLGEPASEQDLEWIEYTLLTINRQKEALRDRLEKIVPYALERYLNLILSGQQFSVDDVSLEFINLHFPHKYLCCLRLGTVDPDVARAATAYVSGESHSLTASFTMFEDAYCIIINGESEYKLTEGLFNLMHTPGFTGVAVGIGSIVSDLSMLHSSYQEARKTLEYLQALGLNTFLTYEVIHEKKSMFSFPMEAENRLTNLVKAGDYDGAVAVINKLIEVNIQELDISLPALRILLLMIDVTLSRAGSKGGVSQSVHEELFFIASMAEILERIEQNVMETCAEAVAGGKIGDVIEYIDKNLSNLSLSLDLVSDRFNYSPNYFSRWFKDRFGVNFIKYVSRKRIEYAKELLVGTKDSISTIANLSGFSSATTFRRLFKEYEGVSPVDYRILEQKNDEKCES